MTSFLVDIWHDLREKRLWPAAVALLAAIVAVPVVLFKPASDATPPNAVAPHGKQGPVLPVVHVDGGPLMGSHLEAFSASEKNPFKPMKDLAKSSTPDTGATPTTGTTGNNPGPGTTTSTNPASGGPGNTSKSPGSTTTPGTTSHTTKTTEWFHYVADFSFGKTGEKAQTFKAKAAYTLLPDEKTPVVVFLGLSDDHKTALFFLTDPGYDAQGEGTCLGTGTCQFVTLSLSDSGDEENYSSKDGTTSYDLQLLDIRRENLGSGSQPATPSTPSSPKNGKAAAGAAGAGVATAANVASEAALPAVFIDGPGLALEQK